MRVLVAYATRHGATRGIAQRIGERLVAAGLEVTVAPAKSIVDITPFDAFVIGGATYMGRWLGEVRAFVRRHREGLRGAPVWLYGSGPLGTDTVDAQGRDVLHLSEPTDFEELEPVLHPRGHVVFFGAFDPEAHPASIAEWLAQPFWKMASVRRAMPSGDFRDWPAIDAYADSIAHQLLHPHVPIGTSTGAIRGTDPGITAFEEAGPWAPV
jgi:menaquinone-dependent protoporphyrinogen oxidase